MHLLPQISVCSLIDSWNREQFEIRRELASINPFANAQAKGREREKGRKGGSKVSNTRLQYPANGFA